MWRNFWLILALAAAVAVAESSPIHVTQPADSWAFVGGSGGGDRSCSSGECIVANDGGERVKTMERRVLKSSSGLSKYASYAALVAEHVPCFLKGKSYYECGAQSEASPYSRGCTVLTRCATTDNA